MATKASGIEIKAMSQNRGLFSSIEMIVFFVLAGGVRLAPEKWTRQPGSSAGDLGLQVARSVAGWFESVGDGLALAAERFDLFVDGAAFLKQGPSVGGMYGFPEGREGGELVLAPTAEDTGLAGAGGVDVLGLDD